MSPQNMHHAMWVNNAETGCQIRGGFSGSVAATVCASADADYDNGGLPRGA
jgi:hypothetical protein